MYNHNSKPLSWFAQLGSFFFLQLQLYFPLVLGLAVGISLPIMSGALSDKWFIFAVVALTTVSVLILLANLTTKTREIILVVSVLSLPFFYGVTIQYREYVPFSVLVNGYPIELFDIGLGLLTISWIYQKWSRMEKFNFYLPINWLLFMGVMLGFNLFSTLYIAEEQFFGFNMIYGQLKCYLTLFFVANYIQDSHGLRILTYTFAGVLICQCIVVMEQQFIGVIFTAEHLGRQTQLISAANAGTVSRLSGSLGHPNAMAMYVNLIMPWIGFQWAIENRKKRKIFLSIALLSGLYCVIMSGSRGAWTGVGIGSAISILLWYRKQGRNPIVALFSLLVIASLIFSVLFATSSTFRTRLTADDQGSAEVRLPLMEVAEEIIRAHPYVGVGLANYTHEMANYDRSTWFVTSWYDQPVHNTYLLIAAETGVPALVVFLLFFLTAVLLALRLALKGDKEISALGLGLLSGLIAWIFHCLVNPTAPYIDTTLWFLFGLLLSAEKQLINRP